MKPGKIKGVVQFFNNKKGWGLISDKNGKIFFIHHSDIVDEKFKPENKPERFRTLKPFQNVAFYGYITNNNKFDAAKSLVILENVSE